ncbi:fungal-specific transcription factor domain-containing protein, partial [Dendryphion nanum]
MPSESQKRRRPVAACAPCYQKKQKCDHQYPCNNCVRRRLPEHCSYSTGPHDADRPSSRTRTRSVRTASVSDVGYQQRLPEENLSSSLGYFEGSGSNLLSLMDKYHLLGKNNLGNDTTEAIPASVLPEMNECLKLFPKRPILDSLVQLFFQDVNWMYEMIHPALFLGRYEKWWRTVPGSTTESLHLGILILRVCAYSAQFSPAATAEANSVGGNKLLGVSMDKIREHCHGLASRLQRLCEQMSGAKSLTWVQQLFYAACYEKNEGNVKDAWYTLGNAVRVVQDLGMHVEEPHRGRRGMNDLEYDMGRRAFWNLYIWDRFLSLVLDRAPCILDSHCSVDLPKMRFLNPALGASAPDVFTERILQAKLSKLWSSLCPPKKPGSATPYDPAAAEECYEEICRSFVSQLPRALDLHAPDTQWDSKLPNLRRQRQTLRISVFVVMCQIFQPLLHLDSDQTEALPQYKRDLLVRHREQLVYSATAVLSSVGELQQLMGGGPSRFFLLSFFTFEPAMLLAL